MKEGYKLNLFKNNILYLFNNGEFLYKNQILIFIYYHIFCSDYLLKFEKEIEIFTKLMKFFNFSNSFSLIISNEL